MLHGTNVKISVYVFYLSQKNYCIMPNDFEVCLMLTIKYRVYLFFFWSQPGSCHGSRNAYEASLNWEFSVVFLQQFNLPYFMEHPQSADLELLNRSFTY